MGTQLRAQEAIGLGDWFRPIAERTRAQVQAVLEPEIPGGPPFCIAYAPLKPTKTALASSNRLGVRAGFGVGVTPTQAAEMALAEAAERYSLQVQEHETTVVASVQEMGGQAVSADALILISERQFRMRQLWNLRHSERHHIPAPPDASQPIAWMAADKSLSTCPKFVPAAYVLLGHRDSLVAPWAQGRSSGAALGTDVADAALRALLEIVERDACAIWWYNALARPGIELASEPWIGEVSTWFGKVGRTIDFIDLSHDIAVPVAAAVSWTGEGTGPIVGTAAAATYSEACTKALRELIERYVNLLFLRKTASEKGLHALDPAAVELLAWHESQTHTDLPHLVATKSNDGVKRRDGGVRVEWAGVKNALEAKGLEVLAFDLTRQDLGAAVVKVVVAGMRSTLCRLAPGRLYEVPVALGWLTGKNRETDLVSEPYPY